MNKIKNYLFSFLIFLMYDCIGQKDTFPVLQGNYLGQKPPGKEAVIFAPGIISTDSIEHSAPAFSTDGNIVLWSPVKRGSYPNSFLLEMRKEKRYWIKPASPSFANTDNDDIYPVFSPDGKKLFFSSRRPLPSGLSPRLSSEGLRIWVVERKSKGWDTALPVDTTISNGFEYAHSVSKNGTLYFSSNRPGSKGSLDIYCSRIKDGKYQPPEQLGQGINTESYEDGPCIAPDESFMIFESGRPGGIEESIDLYICFKQKNGDWTNPRNMGAKINSRKTDRFARLSPDGKYLFFGSTRNGLLDIYWISAKVIDELRPRCP